MLVRAPLRADGRVWDIPEECSHRELDLQRVERDLAVPSLQLDRQLGPDAIRLALPDPGTRLVLAADQVGLHGGDTLVLLELVREIDILGRAGKHLGKEDRRLAREAVTAGAGRSTMMSVYRTPIPVRTPNSVGPARKRDRSSFAKSSAKMFAVTSQCPRVVRIIVRLTFPLDSSYLKG